MPGAVRTIDPDPRSIIGLAAAWAIRNDPVTLTCKTWVNSSAVSSSQRNFEWMPAKWINASSRPNRSTACATTRWQSAASPTSPDTSRRLSARSSAPSPSALPAATRTVATSGPRRRFRKGCDRKRRGKRAFENPIRFTFHSCQTRPHDTRH